MLKRSRPFSRPPGRGPRDDLDEPSFGYVRRVTTFDEWRKFLDASTGDSSHVVARIDELLLSSGQVVEVPRAGVLVIVGANNAGKSTLLRQLHAILTGGQGAAANFQPSLLANAGITRELAPTDLLAWFNDSSQLVDRPEVNGGPFFTVSGWQVSAQSILDGQFAQGYDALQDLHPAFVQFADAMSRLSGGFSSGARSSVDEPASTPLQRFQENRELFDRLSRLSKQVFDRPLLLDDFPGATIQIRVGDTDLPIPARNEPLGEFGRAVAKLPRLDEQGDGMRSFFGLIVPLVADTKKVVLVDEPEAFLHPPQARALGRELGRIAHDRGIQVVVASHDKDFIAGLISSKAELSVVRLIRGEEATTSAQLSSGKLREVWDDRSLRYSNVLDGLFSRLVVICEADQDCRFYEAALDQYVSESQDDSSVFTMPASDVLFIPSNGKAGFVNLVNVLRNLAVPTVVIPDLDVLRDATSLRTLFEALGGDWTTIETDFRIATEGMSRPRRPRTVQSVVETVSATLGLLVANDRNAIYDFKARTLVTDQLNATDDPWTEAKRSGVSAFRGAQLSALERVLRSLDERGIITVRVGELEGFAPELAKNKAWLPEALAQDAHRTENARAHTQRVLLHAQRMEPVQG